MLIINHISSYKKYIILNWEIKIWINVGETETNTMQNKRTTYKKHKEGIIREHIDIMGMAFLLKDKQKSK